MRAEGLMPPRMSWVILLVGCIEVATSADRLPCNGSQTRCEVRDWACVDLQTSSDDCGRCGNECWDSIVGSTCVAGVCVCPAGTTHCGRVCDTLASSNNNCGACGVACTQGTRCMSGACR